MLPNATSKLTLFIWKTGNKDSEVRSYTKDRQKIKRWSIAREKDKKKGIGIESRKRKKLKSRLKEAEWEGRKKKRKE